MSATAAPLLPPGLNWLNANPQTLAAQRGRILVLLFWNASSSYSQNLVDEMILLKARHPVQLNVLGVHVPKFDAEVDDRTVLKALNRLGVNFPVANDRHWVAWQHYGIASWPSVAIIDGEGRLRQIVSGDDQGPQIAALISELIEESEHLATVPSAVLLRGGETRLPLAFPSGLALTDTHLYVADTGHHRVLECNFAGKILREYGTGHPDLVDGPAGEAGFRSPRGLCVVRDYLYVADSGNHALRRIGLLDGRVETLLGRGKPGAPREGVVTAAQECPLNLPMAVVGDNERLYLALAGSNQLWEYEIGNRRMRFLAGNGNLGIGDGATHNAVFAQPSGLALVQQTLYVVDAASSAVRAVQLSHGMVQTLVGQGLYEFGEVDGQRQEARLQFPQAVVLDGNAPVLWVADMYNGELRTLRLGGGGMATHELPQPLYQPSALAMGKESLWIADAGQHEILRHDLNTGLLTRIPVGE